MRSWREILRIWPRLLAGLALSASLLASPSGAQAPTVALGLSDSAQSQAPITGRSLKMESAIAQLMALAGQPAQAQAVALAGGQRLEEQRLQVQVAVAEGAQEAVIARIADLGGLATGAASEPARLQAWLPLDALEALAAMDEVLMLRRPLAPVALDEASPGALASIIEGVQASVAYTWHASGYMGQGVRLAIVDVGFTGYTALLGGALPSSVTVRNFVDFESDAQVDGTTPHGTACAEIAHAMAPGAALYLAKIGTDIDLAEAVAWLRDIQHVQIISTSLGWYTLGPGDGTGTLATLAASARAAGITWVASAGNNRQTHWGGPWWDAETNPDGLLNFTLNTDINLLSVNGDYTIPAGRPLSVYLRWSDWSAVDQDYDLILLRDIGGGNWVPIDSSTNTQAGVSGQTPTEWIRTYTFGVDTLYGFSIKRMHGDRPIQFEAFAPESDRIAVSTAMRSISQPADAPDVLAVGAVQAVAPHAFEPFSSEGPTNGPGGTADGGQFKPDLAAYDAVQTNSWGLFTGTSAAAPHVAGAAALIQGAYPGYSVAQVRALLIARARDMGSAGADTQYGAGRLYLGCSPACRARIWLTVPRRP